MKGSAFEVVQMPEAGQIVAAAARGRQEDQARSSRAPVGRISNPSPEKRLAGRITNPSHAQAVAPAYSLARWLRWPPQPCRADRANDRPSP